MLTHWGRVTHICVDKLTIVGSENGLAPIRRQAIIWTNAGLLSIGHLLTNFSEILIKLQQFTLKKMHLKMSSANRRLCCLGPNVLAQCGIVTPYANSKLGHQVMARLLFVIKPSPKVMLTDCQSDTWEQTKVKCKSRYKLRDTIARFSFKKTHLEISSAKCRNTNTWLYAQADTITDKKECRLRLWNMTVRST